MTEQRVIIRDMASRREAVSAVRAAGHGTVVTLRPLRHSDRQRALFHALLTELSRECSFNGRRLTTDEWKDVFVIGLWGAKWIASPLDPSVKIPIRRSTEGLTVAEYSELIDFTYAEAATELGHRWTAHRPGERDDQS